MRLLWEFCLHEMEAAMSLGDTTHATAARSAR
jgi:hypothetical protein